MIVIDFALVIPKGKQRVLRSILRIFEVFLQFLTNDCRHKCKQEVAPERFFGLDAEWEEVGVVFANIENLLICCRV
jgi:hypothetical protein